MKKTLILTAALLLALCVCAAGCVGNDEPSNGGGGASSSEEVKLNAGDSFTFGTYNGKALEWDVLAVDTKNEKALLITKSCLDQVVKFHEDNADPGLTWETSDLREWLNSGFYDSAFTDEQKGRILEVLNPADTNSESGAHGGNDTLDRVFVLSASEMLRYFADDESMIGLLGGEGTSYWTRTPGNDTSGYVCTYSDGGLYMTGNAADSAFVGVRPAFWLDLSEPEEE